MSTTQQVTIRFNRATSVNGKSYRAGQTARFARDKAEALRLVGIASYPGEEGSSATQEGRRLIVGGVETTALKGNPK